MQLQVNADPSATRDPVRRKTSASVRDQGEGMQLMSLFNSLVLRTSAWPKPLRFTIDW